MNKSTIERLLKIILWYDRICTEYEFQIEGIMQAVDKFLEGDDLKEEDPVKRAARMREKVLEYIEWLEDKVDKVDKGGNTNV